MHVTGELAQVRVANDTLEKELTDAVAPHARTPPTAQSPIATVGGQAQVGSQQICYSLHNLCPLCVCLCYVCGLCE